MPPMNVIFIAAGLGVCIPSLVLSERIAKPTFESFVYIRIENDLLFLLLSILPEALVLTHHGGADLVLQAAPVKKTGSICSGMLSVQRPTV